MLFTIFIIMLQIVVPVFDEDDVVKWVISPPTESLGNSTSFSETYVSLPLIEPCTESVDIINSGAYIYAFLPTEPWRDNFELITYKSLNGPYPSGMLSSLQTAYNEVAEVLKSILSATIKAFEFM